MEMNEKLKREARGYFTTYLFLSTLIILAIIFSPYAIGLGNENSTYYSYSEDSNAFTIWMSGLLELLIIFMIGLFIGLILYIIKGTYCWMWDEAFQMALLNINDEEKKKKKKNGKKRDNTTA